MIKFILKSYISCLDKLQIIMIITYDLLNLDFRLNYYCKNSSKTNVAAAKEEGCFYSLSCEPLGAFFLRDNKMNGINFYLHHTVPH